MYSAHQRLILKQLLAEFTPRLKEREGMGLLPKELSLEVRFQSGVDAGEERREVSGS